MAVNIAVSTHLGPILISVGAKDTVTTILLSLKRTLEGHSPDYEIKWHNLAYQDKLLIDRSAHVLALIQNNNPNFTYICPPPPNASSQSSQLAASDFIVLSKNDDSRSRSTSSSSASSTSPKSSVVVEPRLPLRDKFFLGDLEGLESLGYPEDICKKPC